MTDKIDLDIKGMDKIVAGFKKFPREIAKNMSQAGHQAGSELLREEGLQNYPPEGRGNHPPAPYYKRGTGMQYASGRNDNSSENLKKRWTVKRKGSAVEIANSASYGNKIHGEAQPRHLAKIGWRKLVSTARSKTKEITATYQLWVDKTINDLGL